MSLSRKDEIVLKAEKEICDIIPRLKGIHGGYIHYRDYRSIRNLALAANNLKNACFRIMNTMDFPDEEQKLLDRGLLE